MQTKIKELRNKITSMVQLISELNDGSRQVNLIGDDSTVLNSEVYQKTLSSYADDKTILSIHITKKTVVPLHTHANNETIFVLDGEITDLVSHRVYTAGDSCYIAAGKIHGYATEGCLLLIIYQPRLKNINNA